MKKLLVVLVVVIVLLVAVNMALAQSGGQFPTTWYMVEHGTMAGGNYRLTSLGWQASGATGDGNYTLLGPVAPAASSDKGCCCTFLPCVLR
jgi:hypothetical protein